ncbi:MAG: thioredoxin domain-containing protein [Parcubacteria group bacterium]|nr:thioredoxin domain-containing protein [Parcubacteria group bacterium]
MSEESIRINKKSLKGFLVGVAIAAPIFVGGTYLVENNGGPNPNPNPNTNTNPPIVQDAPEFKIDGDTHFAGDKNADVQLVVYSDFECSYCERHHETVKQIADKYGDDVFIAFKHFPLSFHQHAQAAALASECAAEQGNFWEYADGLFANQANFASEPWLDLAKEIGLDESKFTSCMDSEKFKNKVTENLNEGFDNGVDGTPATFINGELVAGALPFSDFEQIIDSLLQ